MSNHHRLRHQKEEVYRTNSSTLHTAKEILNAQLCGCVEDVMQADREYQISHVRRSILAEWLRDADVEVRTLRKRCSVLQKRERGMKACEVSDDDLLGDIPDRPQPVKSRFIEPIPSLLPAPVGEEFLLAPVKHRKNPKPGDPAELNL